MNFKSSLLPGVSIADTSTVARKLIRGRSKSRKSAKRAASDRLVALMTVDSEDDVQIVGGRDEDEAGEFSKGEDGLVEESRGRKDLSVNAANE